MEWNETEKTESKVVQKASQPVKQASGQARDDAGPETRTKRLVSSLPVEYWNETFPVNAGVQCTSPDLYSHFSQFPFS